MDYTQVQTGRVAAILTNGEVAAFAVKLERCKDAQVTVDLSFTLGSLTNVIMRCYSSMDNSTYDLITGPTGDEMEFTLTANTEGCYIMPNLYGWKFFRVSLQGTDTLTSSTAEIIYRYEHIGGQ